MLKTLHNEFAKTSPARLVAIVWFGFLIGALARFVVTGGLTLIERGHPIPGDFLGFWSAGKMAISGHAASAYDLVVLHASQVVDVGHPFSDVCRWLYPPIFFAIAVPLALLPYYAAYAAWAFGTFASYFVVIARIFRNHSAAVALGIAPACLASLLIAQNGMFTAALFGGALLTLTTSPVLSGFLVAALSYKPQFVALLPLALMAGGHWRVLLVAVLCVFAWLSLALMIDHTIIAAFVHSMAVARHDLLTLGTGGWNKLQTVYGFMRLVGASDNEGTIVQTVVAGTCAVTTIIVWRGPLSYNVKAATIPLLALLATPYAYIYDYPLLSVAVAFLHRERRLDRTETIAVAGAYLLTLVTLAAGVPLGAFAVAVVGTIVIRRGVSSLNINASGETLTGAISE